MGRLAEKRDRCMERGGTRMKKFEYTPPEQPRELILKLGQKITDRIGHTVTVSYTHLTLPTKA